MRTNTLKQKLREGKPAFGCMITIPSAPIVEMLGYLGFDWVLIDNEHGSVTADVSEDMIRAGELSGCAPIVRPIGNKPEFICPFLDRGAWGVQVPHVNTRAEAEAAVSACKYFPDGQRGLYSRGRAANYGVGTTTPEYAESANANTLVCLMLEEVEAINNIDDIVKVKGINVLFIGSGDLSQSMGYPGQQTHPEVLALMEKGVKRIRDAGIVAGVSCPDTHIAKFLSLGVQYFHSNVTNLLAIAGSAYLSAARQASGKK